MNGVRSGIALASILTQLALPRSAQADVPRCRVATHEATFEGDTVRWDTTLFDCLSLESKQRETKVGLVYRLPAGSRLHAPDDTAAPLIEEGRIVALALAPAELTSEGSVRFVVITPFLRTEGGARLTPPLVVGASMQLIMLRDEGLLFVPNAGLAPHRTRHGFEIGRLTPSVSEEGLTFLRRRGTHIGSSALLVGEHADLARTEGLEGTWASRKRQGDAVVAAAGAIFAAAVAGLAAAYGRIRRRVRLELAEAILRADLTDL